jgi:putative endonuclease
MKSGGSGVRIPLGSLFLLNYSMQTEQSCFVYILESEKNGMLYVGCTHNLADRISRHNEGRSKFTKPHRPFRLLYSKEFSSKSLAKQHELKLKALKSKTMLLSIIEQAT